MNIVSPVMPAAGADWITMALGIITVIFISRIPIAKLVVIKTIMAFVMEMIQPQIRTVKIVLPVYR